MMTRFPLSPRSGGRWFPSVGAVVFLLLSLPALPEGTASAPAEALPARRFAATRETDGIQWQQDSRRWLAQALLLDDLLNPRQGGKSTRAVPFEAVEKSRQAMPRYDRLEVEFNSTPTRRISVTLTLPRPLPGAARVPAVVCLHGHGGTQAVVYDTGNLYRGFAHALAGSGYATIAPNVGQHAVYETHRTLMGERLWDAIRCVDYLASRTEIDPGRLGCAGLSLGGEMALWLGAMDDRIRATVSSGFLTTVANLRQGHCPCWDFPGLTENFDFSDLYSLIAPRPLLCQVGELEPPRGGFPVVIARPAMERIRAAYSVWGAGELAQLDVPDVGHVFVLETTLPFLGRHLR